MLDFERRCWAEIDLDNIRHNFNIINSNTNDATVMAVIKANAYGHGDRFVARALSSAGAQWFAVSGLSEAIRLRKFAKLERPILVLGYTSPEHVSRLGSYEIAQCIFSLEYAEELSKAAVASNTQVQAHFKVDTGMGRIGFNAKDNLDAAVEQLVKAYSLPRIMPTGIFTHFSVADSKDPENIEYTKAQFQLFSELLEKLKEKGLNFRFVHSCNSAGMIAYPEMHQNMVRPGIILYGCNPSSDTALAGLKPAFRLKTVVTMVKTLKKGDSVSYGRVFTAPNDMRVATLAVGYADGYPRLMTGTGVVGICGKPAPLVGRVCMDQIVVDVTGIQGVELGSIATVFGGDGADSIDEAAAKCNTINYEILCNIGRRVQRVYIENGEETRLANYLEGEE